MRPQTDIPTSLRTARLALGESQQAFAKRFNVAQPVLSRWERGIQHPGGPTRLLIAKVLEEIGRLPAVSIEGQT